MRLCAMQASGARKGNSDHSHIHNCNCSHRAGAFTLCWVVYIYYCINSFSNPESRKQAILLCHFADEKTEAYRS